MGDSMRRREIEMGWSVLFDHGIHSKKRIYSGHVTYRGLHYENHRSVIYVGRERGAHQDERVRTFICA